MISTIPIDKARNPLVDRHPRLEAEVAAARLDIGVGLLHIARLHVGEFADCGLAAGLLAHFDEEQPRPGGGAAAVGDTVRRGVVLALGRADAGVSITSADGLAVSELAPSTLEMALGGG